MTQPMTSLERTRTVLAGGIPDRVPVDLHNFMMVAEDSGMPFPEFFQNGEAMAEGQIKAWREFGHDVLILENGTAALAEACGAQVEYMEGSAPVCHGPAIRSLDDLDKLKVPDPYKAFPLTENLKTTRIVAQEIGDKAFIIGRADQGPFSLAAMLLGMEEFLLRLAQADGAHGGRRGGGGDPELAKKLHRLLEFSLAVTTRYAYAQIEAGAHMTSIGESLSGPDVCSPKSYKTFEWSYAKRMVENLKADNIQLAYHICGDATAIVPDMVETGAMVLELDYKVDMPAVKAATRGRATVLGPVDPSGVMALGAPSDVERAAREAIDILGEGGGLILGPGCALPPKTPPENVHTLIETARKYGVYA
ncbi:uroporphyrinogen decarboxylase family protein [Caldilinea sp.]|uniref:uroporphyrinogen decarboxylase family protein n=1 Tax=Caldilinea sp. TaxID=2293560 RepID=UPI002BF41419|nr:uroporphyrinogen decarboxylase family protein [Caldilinea sp.]